MLTHAQRARVDVILVSPRNPLNMGAVARAMANFGFASLHVVAPYAPHWREARSAVGAPSVLAEARESGTLAEAIAACTFVAGTGTLTHRKPEQAVLSLEQLAPRMEQELAAGGRAALVLGPEKHGLTREDLSYCHALVQIPTDQRQPSMNLGQAAAVCLYELARPTGAESARKVSASMSTQDADPHSSDISDPSALPVSSVTLDRLGELIQQTMQAAHYSPATMRAANQHDLRLLLRRLHLSAHDTRRALGLFRRILWRLEREPADPRT